MKALKILILLMAFSLGASADDIYIPDSLLQNQSEAVDDGDYDEEDDDEAADPDAKYAVDSGAEDSSADLDMGSGSTGVTYEDDSKYAKYKDDGTLYFYGDNAEELTPSEYVSYKNRNKILDLIFRFLINTIFVLIIARAFYFPKSRRRDFFFTYILVGFAIFMLIHLMSGETMETGIGMGLFAIFCIMRYRTESVPIREMTYLFVIIAMAALNGMAWDISIKKPDYMSREMISMAELILTNVLFIIIVWLSEGRGLAKGLSSKYIKYDKIDLILPEKRQELIADLKARTGLDITSVSIGSIDFLKDMALIKIFYHDEGDEEEGLEKMPKVFG